MGAGWTFLLLGLCVVEIQSFCMFRVNERFSNMAVTHCVGENADDIYKIGETKVTEDCLRCTCSDFGLECCGIGPNNSGIYDVPEGCHIVTGDNCAWTISCSENYI